MCGIAGFVGEGSQQVLEKMTRALTYRGPDGEGYFYAAFDSAGSFARAAALGHRRLSIIDVAGGAQPIFNEDKTIAVVFNGEIYNFRELREKLEQNHTFVTHSDTEVIVHLYEDKGENCVKYLEGMFVFALWDAKKELLVLARDRFGEKPLYYTDMQHTFLFGSELKALFEHQLMKIELDSIALQKYFIYECVPAPHTILQNVYKLEAGHLLTFANGKYEVTRYWNLLESAERNHIVTRGLSLREAIQELDERLNSAVKKMLVSDVPLGVFLSGGVDSSTVAYYAQQNSNQKIKTFSIGFNDPTYDESKFAAEVATRIGSEHHMKTFMDSEIIDALPSIYTLLDEPLGDPSLVPTYFLAKFAREYVTVTLGGDGSDELFMGYSTFQAEKLSRMYARVPLSLRNSIVRPLIERMPTSFNYLSLDYRLKKFVFNFEHPVEIRNQLWIGAFTPRELERLFQEPLTDRLFEDIMQYMEVLRQFDNYHQLSYLYTKHYMQDDILAKVDRASMFNSLEVRAPFLDPSLASWVFALPLEYKLRRFTTKYVLKRLMARRLGRNIVYRKKQGFQPPVARWINEGSVAALVDEHLNETKIRAEALFNAEYVTQILKEHRSGVHNHRKKIWSLLVFQLWKMQFGK